jgi:hypothetical protein
MKFRAEWDPAEKKIRAREAVTVPCLVIRASCSFFTVIITDSR